MYQIKHDILVTLLATVCGAGVEILMCYLWANDYSWMRFNRDLNPFSFQYLFVAAFIIYWRAPHFHIMHRAMHPWRTKVVPDFGRVLYRHVHSLHHKSHNPTAFSGTNMHPVEATLYYTAAFVPALWGGCHPIIGLTAIIDCAMGAWLSHDGFQWPGSGDYYHMLHHRK